MTDQRSKNLGLDPGGWVGTGSLLVLLVLSGIATIRWLISSEPLGALVPAPFLVFSLWSLVLRRKYGELGGMAHSYPLLLNFMAVATIAGVFVLYFAGRSAGKGVYTHQATSLAIFGGCFVLLALLGLFPKVRERWRKGREFYEREKPQDIGER